MKKLIVLLITLIVSTSLAYGAFIEIGDGTGTQSYNPCYGYYNYSWSQTIYLQSEIGMAVDITGVMYNVSNAPSSYQMDNQEVWVGHTALNEFPDNVNVDPAALGFTQVYSGSVVWNGGGWQGIDFTVPFSYNGTDNLMIVWINADGLYATGYPSFYYTNIANRMVYDYDDYVMPGPGHTTGYLSYRVANVRLQADIPYAVSMTQLTPDASIMMGQTFDYLVQVTNMGDNADVYDLALTGGTWVYEIRDDAGVISTLPLAAGASDEVIVRVTAPVAKDVSDMVTFTATSQGDPLVAASVDITTTAYEPYLTFFENFDTCTPPDLPPKWSRIVQTTSTYPYVDTYSSATYAYSGLISVKMYNSSDLASELLLVTPALETGIYGNVLSAMVRSSSGTQNILVGTMTDPNDPSTFSLVQSFPVTNTYTEIVCPINFPTKGTGYVAFKHGNDGTYDYYYIDDVAWEEIIPEPEMIIDETAHDFGIVEKGTVENWDVTIYNDGFGTLYFNGVTINPPFSVTYPDSIEALSNDIVTVTLDATEVGLFNEVLKFHTNATQDSTIVLDAMVIGPNYVMQGFEDTEFPPFGWQNICMTWSRFTTEAYEGDGYARCPWYHDADAILMSPRLVIESGDFIDFWWRNDNLYEAKGSKVITGDTLYVEISNDYLDPNPTWECLAMLSADEVMDEYEEVFLAIPDTYIGYDAKIRWRHRSIMNSESRGVGLDNILMPHPYMPVNLAVEPDYQSDYIGPENALHYMYEVTNLGIQNDRFILTVQDSSAIRYNAKNVENFELTDGGWVATADWDPVGDWAWTNDYNVNNYTGTHDPPPAAHSGTGLWATVPEGDYTNSGGYSYMSKTVDFSGITDAYMNFWYWSDIFGDWDYCEVLVNGDLQITIDEYPGTAWEYAELDLSAYDGLSDVEIVFSFYATTVVEYSGMYIDDLDIPGGGGPGPGPTGWPAFVNVPYLDLGAGESGMFELTIQIPEDAEIDDTQLTPVLVFSREDNDVCEQVFALAVCHERDPYEPNDILADATPADYEFVSEGAQIYFNPDYKDKDIDIYTIDCLEGEIVWCAFELPETETQFDGAIKLVDADGIELAWADSWAGGGSEYLEYRIQDDGTYYWILGKWDEILDGPSRKAPSKGINTTYYTVAFDLIPSPEIDVWPPEMSFGIVVGSEDVVDDELYISNVATHPLAADLHYNLEVQVPGCATLYQTGFDDQTGWTTTGGTNWGFVNTSNAGGTPPEARFYWSPSTTALQRLISPVINTTGYASATLSFKHYVNDYSGGYTIGVATSSDGGTTWNDVWSTSPAASIGPETMEITVDNADMGSDQFQVCWYFDGYSFNINYWYVDDVCLSIGTSWLSVVPPSGTVGQGNTATLNVSCNSDGLDPGVYSGDIIVHNDALLYGASDVTVPVYLTVGTEAGGLQGTVTYEGEPVEDVLVKAGNFQTYTDEFGYYEFDSIVAGMFDVYFYKEGFQPYWVYDVILGAYWVVVLDVEMLFEGPVPENLSATGMQEAINLDWDKPQTGGGGGGTQVDYIFDDGTYENGWCINPGYSSWLGNKFPVTDGGELISFQIYGYENTIAGAEQVTLDIFDSDQNYVGSSDPFTIPVEDWVTVPVPNIPFSGEFYAMIHWDNLVGQTNWVGFDENGPYANSDLDYYYDGTSFQLLHVVAVSTPGVFLQRATAMVRGRTVELAYDTYKLGKEPEVYFRFDNNENLEAGQQILDNVFVQSGQSGDTGNYEVSHYTFKDITELGFKMPEDITLLGYKVYEQTKGLVAYVDGENNTQYTDDIVAVGEEFCYWVTALYEEGESGPSNMDCAVPLPEAGGYHEPFDVNWSQTGWTTQGSPNNWTWATGYAYLYWSPSVDNYDMSLLSPEIDVPADPADVWDITISMYISDYSTDEGEVMEIWIVSDDKTETMIFEWDLDVNDDWGVSGGTDFVYTDTGQFAGQTVQFKFRSHGGSTFNFNYWYIYDVLWEFAGVPPLYGALEGYVYDSDGIALEDVRVTAEETDYNPVYTDEFGYYTIDPMAAGLYDIEYYKPGYTLVEYSDIEILPGETTILDATLGNPTMDITPLSINVIIPLGGTTTRTINVANNGSAPLNWSAAILDMTEYLNEIAELKNHGTLWNPNAFAPETEVSPNGVSYILPPNDDMWDLQFDWPCAIGEGEAGIETNGTYVYTSNWGYAGNGIFHRYEMDGTYIEQFTIAGISGGIRDLAYDGEYFYGGMATNTVYVLDLDNEQLISTFTAPTAVRAIAYDSDADGFWANNWDTTITLFDRQGNFIDGFACGTFGSYYGFAYDPYSTGGPYLWGFSQDGSGGVIVQIDVTTGLETGVTHDVLNDVGIAGSIAGGLFLSEGEFVPGTLTLGGLLQNDVAFGYDVGTSATWIVLDPTAGTVNPGNSEDVTVFFDAGDDPAGTVHICDIVFDSPQGVPSVTVPVTAMVAPPDYGDLSGTVTAVGGGAIVGAEVTATQGAAVYTTYTIAGGAYEILDIPVGLYDVECTAVGYNPQLVPGVEIFADQTTVQNFALTAPNMAVTPPAINATIEVGEVDTTYITINNTGNGPMDYNVNLYDYGKTLTDYSNCSNGVTVGSQNGVQTGPGNSNGFQADATRDVVVLHYDGTNDDAIGLTSGGTFMVAARFTATELGLYYDDYEIQACSLFIQDPGSAMTLKIWEGGSLGDPGSEVHSQDIWSQITALSWNYITLSSAVPLIAGNEYWLGYEVTHAAAEYPAGCDAGPAVLDKGTWIYFNSAWSQISDYGFDVNWNIRMIIDYGTPPWITVGPTSGTIPAGGSAEIAVVLDATELTLGDIKTADIEIVPTPDVGTVIVPVTLTTTDTIVSTGDEVIKETKLYANYPNPILNSTTFSFALKERSHVKLSIYNAKGQLVQTLVDTEIDPTASYTVNWDGTVNGKKLANGIYFYKLDTNSKSFLNKMILMK